MIFNQKNTQIVSLFAFILFVNIYCSAQKNGFVSVVIDPKMLIKGPYEDSENGELDFVLKLSDHTETSEIGIAYERFASIDYSSYGIFYNQKIDLPILKDTSYILGVESGFIRRQVEDHIIKLSFALNAGVRYDINSSVGVEVSSNYRYRSDLVELYDSTNPMIFSGYMGVYYTW
ncbi:MAG: hypothetical protein ACPHXR_03485 [Flavicella sp.]